MGRSIASPATRLKMLDRARLRARNELKRGETLTARPMAGLIGVSWNQLREWCEDIPGFADSGAFDQGGQGVEWVFRPVKTIDFLAGHFRKESAARAKRVRKLVGADKLADVPDDFDLDQISKMVRVASQLREERERQGQLTDTDRVKHALREMFSRMQKAGLQAAQQQDPSGHWPAEVRESFDDAINTVLLSMETAGTDCLRAIRGDASQPG